MTMTLSGDGAITGLVAGGLPDATIQTADIVDGAVTAAKIAGGTGSGNLTTYTTTTTPLPTAGSAFTGSHSLGVVPAEAVLELTCLTAEQGYSVGDVVQPAIGWNGTVAVVMHVWKNTTSVGLFQGVGTVIVICNKTTGVAASPTVANWSYRFRLRAA